VPLVSGTYLRHRRWLDYCDQVLRSRTVTRYRQNLKNLFAGISCARVAQLSAEVITAYRKDRLAANATARTVNMEVGALSTMLTWGVEHSFIATNRLTAMSALPEDDAKEGRALSPEEVSRLLAAATPHYRPIWYTFLVTGLRRDELANLQFSDIDWDSRELLVRSGTAKNHTTRRVPVDDELYHILRSQQEAACDRKPGRRGGVAATARIAQRVSADHVLVTAQNTPLGGNLYREFMQTCKRAGIETETLAANRKIVEHVDIHSLRRTFATNLIENGTDPRTVQELLGHKTLAMTMKIYAKVRSQTKRQAIGRLSYGAGAQAPAGIIEFPGGKMNEAGNQPERNAHKLRTSAGDNA
jgi:integrase